MNYAQIYSNKKELKIPTVISFLLVGLIIFLIATFFFNTANFSTASRQEVGRVEISNIFPNQVTIFWQTSQEKPSWIIYGTSANRLDRIALDKKDSESEKKAYKNHYSVIQNLQENTHYFYKIVVDNRLVSQDGGAPFTFTTVDGKIGVNNLQPAYGKIVDQNGKPVENAVVSLFIENAYPLSALSKSSGEWLIPLNYVIDKNTKSLKAPDKEEGVKLEIVEESGRISNVVASLTDVSPTIDSLVVGRDYNLLEQEEVLSANSQNNQTASIEITYPREKATIPGSEPLIKGKAVPGNTVSVRISDGKSTTSTQVKTDAKGVWQVALGQKLEVGPQQIIIQTKDSTGEDVSLTRNFVIAKSGEQVLAAATESASPTVTTGPTPAETETPTPTENLTPTIPESGGDFTYIGLSSAALVLLGLGLLLLF